MLNPLLELYTVLFVVFIEPVKRGLLVLFINYSYETLTWPTEVSNTYLIIYSVSLSPPITFRCIERENPT